MYTSNRHSVTSLVNTQVSWRSSELLLISSAVATCSELVATQTGIPRYPMMT
jgi:hypothetical protein